MTWYGSITSLRTRAGLDPGDDSRDADLELAAGSVLDIVETYLDRGLEQQDVTEEQVKGWTRSFQVHRWPILAGSVEVGRFTGNDAMEVPTLSPVKWARINERAGLIYMPMVGKFVVSYTGGFDPLPAALTWALFAVWDAYWYATPGWGAAAGGSTTASGDVKKVSLVGIGAIDFDTGSSTSSSSATSAFTSNPWGLIPAEVVSILDRFRNSSPIGAG